MAWGKTDPKKKLIKEGKELGLNLDDNMSIYELEHRIAEAKEATKKNPEKKSSEKRGEY